MPAPRPITRHPYIQAIIITTIWGWGSPIMKPALDIISPYTFLSYRYFFTSIIFVLYLYLNRSKLKFPQTIRQYIILFFYGSLGMGVKVILGLEGLSRTTSLEASFIESVSPVIIAIVSVIFLKETLTFRETVGFLVSLLGTMAIILSPSNLIPTGDSVDSLFGNILVFSSVLIGAIVIVLAINSLKTHISPAIIAATSFFCGLIITTPAALYEQGSLPNLLELITSLPTYVHFSVWYMILLGGFLAHLYNTRIQAIIPVHRLVILQYLRPILVAPLAVYWLGESFDPIFVAGGLIILFGVYLSQTHHKIIPRIPHIHFHLHH